MLLEITSEYLMGPEYWVTRIQYIGSQNIAPVDSHPHVISCFSPPGNIGILDHCATDHLPA